MLGKCECMIFVLFISTHLVTTRPESNNSEAGLIQPRDKRCNDKISHRKDAWQLPCRSLLNSHRECLLRPQAQALTITAADRREDAGLSELRRERGQSPDSCTLSRCCRPCIALCTLRCLRRGHTSHSCLFSVMTVRCLAT